MKILMFVTFVMIIIVTACAYVVFDNILMTTKIDNCTVPKMIASKDGSRLYEYVCGDESMYFSKGR